MVLERLRRVDWFWLAVGALTATIIFQQYSLLTANQQLRDQIVFAAKEMVEPGDPMIRLTGFGIGREPVTQTLADPAISAVIIGISPFCGTCIANSSAWKRIEDAAVAQGVSVIFVSRELPEATRKFVLTNLGGTKATIIADPTYATYKQMRLRVVPQTAIVTSGTVNSVWPGLIDESDEAEIVAALRRLSGPDKH